MTKRIFVTATDTDAGKTLVSAAILAKLSQSKKVAGFKPVSAGCDYINDELVNEDARLLQSVANVGQSIGSVNPIAFEQPIAPHIAAQTTNSEISVEHLVDYYQQLLALNADVVLTEGAGGWRLPLGNNAFLSDFAARTEQSVIIVVNMKLGCLNHACLTYEAVRNDGLNCIGWVANCIEEMPYLTDNINELTSLLPIPCLGVIPKVNNYQEATAYINIEAL